MIIFDHMLIGNAIDSGGVTLPLELADGIELTLADADQATAVRESLRYFERRMTGSTQHPEATVLDRRVHARDHDDPLDWRDIFDPTLNAPDGSSGGKIELGKMGPRTTSFNTTSDPSGPTISCGSSPTMTTRRSCPFSSR